MPVPELFIAPLTLVDPAMLLGVLCGCVLFAISYRLTLASVQRDVKSAPVCTISRIGGSKRAAQTARVSFDEDRLLDAA